MRLRARRVAQPLRAAADLAARFNDRCLARLVRQPLRAALERAACSSRRRLQALRAAADRRLRVRTLR